MIVEAIQHLLIPAPKYVKALGYLQETIAIEARYKRCQKQWHSHLEKCKELIINATEPLAPQSNIMILGSGSFFDVPIDVLRERQFNITCVDIVHLPHIKKRHPDVTYVTKDITGMVEPVYNAVKRRDIPFAEPEWELKQKPEIIISLNLLSQLAIKLLNYAEDNDFDLGINFQNHLIASHINWLKKQNTKILLISDISREYYQNEEFVESVSSIPPYEQLSLNYPLKTWLWDIAPTGEADKEISIKHTVGAWVF